MHYFPLKLFVFVQWSGSGVYKVALKLSFSDVIVCQKSSNGDVKLYFFGRDSFCDVVKKIGALRVYSLSFNLADLRRLHTRRNYMFLFTVYLNANS